MLNAKVDAELQNGEDINFFPTSSIKIAYLKENKISLLSKLSQK